ncbi:MAG TPA: glycosyltransferase family 4 protein [Rhodocyclaceae bacterium]
MTVRPMRIAFINPQSVPGDLPSTLQALQMVDAFAQCGHAVDVVTPAPSAGLSARQILGREAHPGVHWQHSPALRRRWFFPFSSHRLFYRHAIQWLRRERPDVAYVRNLKLAEAILQALPQQAVVFETHELFAQSFAEHHAPLGLGARRKLRALERREAYVYGKCRGLVAITETLLGDIRQRYGDTGAALVAPDGVDPEPAARALAVPRTANARPALLYLGSLHRWKGVETVIDALPAIADCDLWIAGGGTARMQELAQRPSARACAGRLHLLGQIPPAERFELIAKSDLCLLPLTQSSIGSRYTSPLKLFEYMAMGKPILASDHPSLREVLRHGDNGWLVAPDDPARLAEGASKLLADPALRAALGAQALADSRRYTWRARAEAVTKWMESICSA